MNKTKIEWCDYTWNPIKGYCPNNCSYCYAHRMYERFGWDKTIRLDEKELCAMVHITKPSRIFVGSTIDMYHPDINTEWVQRILACSCQSPQHTFITLTKYPEIMGRYTFPNNWWIGTTIDGDWQEYREVLMHNANANIRFISFEPLLTGMNNISLSICDWIIIGGLTPKPAHKKEWIDDIVNRAVQYGIPVFIKDNAHYPIVRREFPNIVV